MCYWIWAECIWPRRTERCTRRRQKINIGEIHSVIHDQLDKNLEMYFSSELTKMKQPRPPWYCHLPQKRDKDLLHDRSIWQRSDIEACSQHVLIFLYLQCRRLVWRTANNILWKGTADIRSCPLCYRTDDYHLDNKKWLRQRWYLSEAENNNAKNKSSCLADGPESYFTEEIKLPKIMNMQEHV